MREIGIVSAPGIILSLTGPPRRLTVGNGWSMGWMRITERRAGGSLWPARIMEGRINLFIRL